jgi:hypothetical protein
MIDASRHRTLRRGASGASASRRDGGKVVEVVQSGQSPQWRGDEDGRPENGRGTSHHDEFSLVGRVY